MNIKNYKNIHKPEIFVAGFHQHLCAIQLNSFSCTTNTFFHFLYPIMSKFFWSCYCTYIYKYQYFMLIIFQLSLA